jgi:prolyl-tRNA synthetase
MKQSMFYIPTLKESPKDAEAKSHALMIRSGMIKQTAAGIYTYLPLGLKVLKKIEAIVREEHNALGCSEVLMPALQPKDLWEESGRWEVYGPELMRLKDRKDREFCLGPTHEEVITALVRDYLNSYKKLPAALYQIQTKFRDEMRPRFGLMRGREFIMKDLYTFHATEDSLNAWYEDVKQMYVRIFERCGLVTKMVASTTGEIGGLEAHEFMVMSEVGEDTVVYCENAPDAYNIEATTLRPGDPCPDGNGVVLSAEGIEVGNTFKIGTKYSSSMQAYFQDENGQRQPILMASYGIGIGRTLMAVVEQHSTDEGLIWPENLSPFDLHLMPLNGVTEEVEALYQSLKASFDVLMDDRDERPGVKFNDAKLIGIPIKVILGRGFEAGTVELEIKGDKKDVPVADLIATIEKINRA